MAKLHGLTGAYARALGNMAFTSGVAVIGSTASAFTTSVAIAYTVDGQILSKAAMTNQALAVASGYPAFKVQPAGTTVFYTLALDSAGTPTAWQGTYDGEPITSPSGLSVYGDGSIPDVPDGFTPFAVLKVVSGGSAFTPATTALTSIGTFRNVSVLPVADTF